MSRLRDPRRSGNHVLELASEHQLDKRVNVEVARASGCLAYAVPHDGNAIAELEDLVEAMADIDDRLAALREAADHLENPFAVRLSERGGWFIEDENARIVAD